MTCKKNCFEKNSLTTQNPLLTTQTPPLTTRTLPLSTRTQNFKNKMMASGVHGESSQTRVAHNLQRQLFSLHSQLKESEILHTNHHGRSYSQQAQIGMLRGEIDQANHIWQELQLQKGHISAETATVAANLEDLRQKGGQFQESNTHLGREKIIAQRRVEELCRKIEAKEEKRICLQKLSYQFRQELQCMSYEQIKVKQQMCALELQSQRERRRMEEKAKTLEGMRREIQTAKDELIVELREEKRVGIAVGKSKRATANLKQAVLSLGLQNAEKEYEASGLRRKGGELLGRLVLLKEREHYLKRGNESLRALGL